MNKTTFLDIWNNLHPLVHFWIILSTIGIVALYGAMSYM